MNILQRNLLWRQEKSLFDPCYKVTWYKVLVRRNLNEKIRVDKVISLLKDQETCNDSIVMNFTESFSLGMNNPVARLLEIARLHDYDRKYL